MFCYRWFVVCLLAGSGLARFAFLCLLRLRCGFALWCLLVFLWFGWLVYLICSVLRCFRVVLFSLIFSCFVFGCFVIAWFWWAWLCFRLFCGGGDLFSWIWMLYCCVFLFTWAWLCVIAFGFWIFV